MDVPPPIRLARLRTKLLIREARRLAGLTQAELAARVGTTQSAVSRWERGDDEPRVSTLAKILHACGLEAELAFRARADVDRAQIREHLALTPSERLDVVENVAAFHAATRPRPREEVPAGA